MRHDFASKDLTLGERMPTIGKLLGRTQVQMAGQMRPPRPGQREGLSRPHR